jgi:paraquat-inducible protein A
MRDSALIACPECDCLQRIVDLPPAGKARCRRCGVVMYRNPPHGLDRSLALTVAALLLFLVANAFPIASLDVRGQTSTTTLFGAVLALAAQGRDTVAFLVLLTAIVAPAIQLAALCWLLLPRSFAPSQRIIAAAVRVFGAVRPWALIDVFMLGVLVSLVRLAPMSEVVPGVALWSFAGVILLLAALASSLELRQLWSHGRAAS